MDRATRGLIEALLGLWVGLLVLGCGRLPVTGDQARVPSVYETISQRLDDFRGFEGTGTASFQRRQETYGIPFSLKVSRDFGLDITISLDDPAMPFQGEVKLVSTDSTSWVYTPLGVFDLEASADGQGGVRPLLLSLFGGGDWLVPWLRRQGCEIGKKVECNGLEIELAGHRLRRSVGSWRIKVKGGEAAFLASIYDYGEEPDLQPWAVVGIIMPQEIDVRLEYDEIKWFN